MDRGSVNVAATGLAKSHADAETAGAAVAGVGLFVTTAGLFATTAGGGGGGKLVGLETVETAGAVLLVAELFAQPANSKASAATPKRKGIFMISGGKG
jgi:hypothetical protein